MQTISSSLEIWVWKNWKTSNIHWPVVIFSVNILLCTWKRELLMKIHCHRAVLSAFVSKGTVYYSTLLMLYERFETIQILLLSLFFEHNLQKCQRWCAPWENATGGAGVRAAQRMADLSSITVLRPKKPLLFCTGTNPKCFTLFSPTRWNVNKMSLLACKSWPFPFLLATARVHWSTQLLLPVSSGTATQGHPGSRRFSCAYAACPGSQ